MEQTLIEQIRKRRHETRLKTLVPLDTLIEHVFQPLKRVVYEASILLRSIERSSNPIEINNCVRLLIRLIANSQPAMNSVIGSDGYKSAVSVVTCFFGFSGACDDDWPSNIGEQAFDDAIGQLAPHILVDDLSKAGLEPEILEELRLSKVESLSYRDLVRKVNDPDWIASIGDRATRFSLQCLPDELSDMLSCSYLAHSCAIIKFKLCLNPFYHSNHLDLIAVSNARELIAGLDQCAGALKLVDLWTHLINGPWPLQDESSATLVTGKELEEIFDKESGTARKWKSRGIIKPVDKKGPRKSHRYDLDVAKQSIEAYIGKNSSRS